MRDSFPSCLGWHGFPCRFTRELSKFFPGRDSPPRSCKLLPGDINPPRERFTEDFPQRIDQLNHNFKKIISETILSARPGVHGNNLEKTLRKNMATNPGNIPPGPYIVAGTALRADTVRMPHPSFFHGPGRSCRLVVNMKIIS